MSSTSLHILLPEVYYLANDPLWWFEQRKCSCGYTSDIQDVKSHIAQQKKKDATAADVAYVSPILPACPTEEEQKKA